MKKIRFLMIGGFLGAGKTTTIAAIARHYMQSGKRIGIVTNDQAYDLVDTQSLQSQGFDVGEVPGACFCCRFNDLMSTLESIDQEHAPEIIIAEPVGSCTDLVATVLEPMRHLYGERFELGPLAVLIKPEHGLKILTGAKRKGFSPQAEYIFLKQMEEADVLVLNKIDKLSDSQRTEIATAVGERFPDKPYFEASTKEAIGLEPVIDAVSQLSPTHTRFMDVDYETYAQGEADLGWLNCQASVNATTDTKISLDEVVLGVVQRVAQSLESTGSEPAHLKVMGQSGLDAAVANHVSSGEAPELSMSSGIHSKTVELTINARIACDPDSLRSLVEEAVQSLANENDWQATIDGMQCFQPAPPTPTHRYSENSN